MEERKSNGLAIASFIIGLLCFLSSCCYGGFLGIISLILGIIALTKGQSKGFSITGIVFSVTALIVSFFSLLFGFALLGEIDDSNSSTNANTDSTTTNSSSSTDITYSIKETIICDENGIKATVLSLEDDCIKVKIENNSEKTITAESVTSINNCMMYSSSLYYSGIAPGNSANCEIPLDDLARYGIETIGTLEIAMKIHEESENFSSLWFRTDSTKLETNYSNAYTAYSPNGKEVFNDTYSVHFISVEDTLTGKSVLLYVNNLTDDNFVFSCENLAINNLTSYIYDEEEIFAGSGSIIEVTVSNDFLEENNITEIDNVDLGAYIYSTVDYQSITDTQQIKFSTK